MPRPANTLLLRGDALTTHQHQLAALLRVHAECGHFDGRQTARNEGYINACRHRDWPTGTVVIFTRDTDHHLSGWLKNPDYERCWHLSLSFFDPQTHRPRTPDRDEAPAWARAFFPVGLNLIWVESAKSPEGIALGVQHWRLFCDAHWLPLLPRGEVYSTQLTELGWESASEVMARTSALIGSTVDPN